MYSKAVKKLMLRNLLKAVLQEFNETRDPDLYYVEIGRREIYLNDDDIGAIRELYDDIGDNLWPLNDEGWGT